MKADKQKVNYLTRNKAIINLGFLNGVVTGFEEAQDLISNELCKLDNDSKEYLILKSIFLQLELDIQQSEKQVDQQIKVIDDAIRIKAEQKKIKSNPLKKLFNKTKNPNSQHADQSE